MYRQPNQARNTRRNYAGTSQQMVPSGASVTQPPYGSEPQRMVSTGANARPPAFGLEPQQPQLTGEEPQQMQSAGPLRQIQASSAGVNQHNGEPTIADKVRALEDAFSNLSEKVYKLHGSVLAEALDIGKAEENTEIFEDHCLKTLEEIQQKVDNVNGQSFN